MKLFNLTDIETPALKTRGWLGVPITIGRTVISPGEEVDVGDTEIIRRDLLCFTVQGAIAVGARPPAYLLAQAERASRARLAAAETAAKEKRQEKK